MTWQGIGMVSGGALACMTGWSPVKRVRRVVFPEPVNDTEIS